jgi:hypothetical protein
MNFFGNKNFMQPMEGSSVHSSALLLFLLNFGRGARGGISFHFSLVPNVFPNIILPSVLSHFHLLKSLEPHLHPFILFQVGFFFNIYKFYFFLFFTLYLVSSFLEFLFSFLIILLYFPFLVSFVSIPFL